MVEEKRYEGYVTDNVVDFTIEGIKQFTQPFFMMLQFFNDHRPFDPPHKYEHFWYDQTRIPEPGTFYDDYSMRASAAREARMRIANMPDFHPPQDLTERQRKQWNYQKFMGHFLATLRSQDDNVGRCWITSIQAAWQRTPLLCLPGTMDSFWAIMAGLINGLCMSRRIGFRG